jgi:hypothetical protein
MSWRDEENRLRDGFLEVDSTGHSSCRAEREAARKKAEAGARTSDVWGGQRTEREMLLHQSQADIDHRKSLSS